MRISLLVVLGLTLVLNTPLPGADWPGFRGPNGDGQTQDPAPPLTWNEQTNVKWKVSLPQPANGSPVVSRGHVFVTAAEDAEGKRRSLYCFDRQSGQQRWVRTVEHDQVEETHRTNPYCGSTPAADGERVVVWHGSAGLYCYDFTGQELWHVKLGEFPHIWGYGTSPVIDQDRVIMHCGPGPRVFLTAIDLATGKTLWKTDEPIEGDGSHRHDKKYMGSWSTPVVIEHEGQKQILCSMPTRVVSYAPKDGRILWWCSGLRGPKGDLAYSSPVLAGDICVVTGGFNGPGMAFKLGGSGDITESNRLWRNETNPQSIGSGVVVDGYFYRPNAGPGTLECLEPATGKVRWTSRETGTMWGSIVCVAGKCYVTNQRGKTIVFEPNPNEFKLLAENDLGEASNSTPAISDGEVFLRTEKNLYCISSPQTP